MNYLYKTSLRAFSALMLLVLAVTAQARVIIPAPPELNASSYILLDADSGKILVEHNADKRLPPASLTKMMTAYIVERELASGNIHLSDMVTVSKKAWQMKGSLMFLEVGQKVSVENLLKGLIIVSGNDAAVALAQYVAGGEDSFADLMNSTAQQLGMKNTHFVNASGYPAENHYSTAHDLAILSEHIIRDYPERYAVYKEKYFQFGVNKKTGKPLNPQPNRNRLLWSDPGVDGLKTGHTDKAGYCLAVSAKRDDRRLIAVVMGTPSDSARTTESKKLLTYGFRFFDNVKVKSGNTPLEQVRVWKGDRNEVNVGLAEDLVVTIPRGSQDKLSASMVMNGRLEAPIEKGQQVGVVKVRLDDEDIREVPLLALNSVHQGSFFSRLWDSIVLFFTGLFK